MIKNKTKSVIFCVGVILSMGLLTYAAVPLYDLFCRVTGYGGTTSRALMAPETDNHPSRDITIRFDASLAHNMFWDFSPPNEPVILKLGEVGMAFYEAHNPTNRPIKGMASFNITPQEAGTYFSKIDCFCFREQLLQAGETAKMSVTFFVNPAIMDDRQLKDVKVITLSYTFFPLEDFEGDNQHNQHNQHSQDNQDDQAAQNIKHTQEASANIKKHKGT